LAHPGEGDVSHTEVAGEADDLLQELEGHIFGRTKAGLCGVAPRPSKV